ncbi:MAG TPA: TonB-dependent receptor [Pyrinomonadaceae bacterium]|nr:TonB-dependent receptor [Pyrinomonadaceae bacterium]
MSHTPMQRFFPTLMACGLLMIALTPFVFSQQNLGTIKGTVTDQLEGLVVNATVIARDAQGKERTTTTNASGNYEFRSLPAGRYDLKATAVGFTLREDKQIAVKLGATTTVDLQLSIEALEQSVTVDNKGISTDSDRNADARVLRARELEALPDDPEALASTLQAMAGPTQGENAPQVTVDGFSNGQVPPKEAIREVRINQNPYSAENEYPGWGGIEIYTQPGSEKFHGGINFSFNDESLNSRNPFAPRRAPYQQRGVNLNLTGPIVPKRASFAFYFGRYASEGNSVINATILDPVTLRPAQFNQTLVTPQLSYNYGLRGDLKVNKKHTLVANYEYSQFAQDLQGVGEFALPSRAYRGARTYHNLQVTETAIINEKTINETRLQISQGIFRQRAITALPALNVAESFFGGGSQLGSASNLQDRLELQNFTSWSAGKHFLKIGGRLRSVRIKSISPSNFGGTYTFAGGTGPTLDANDSPVPGGPAIAISSLERYRRTLVFQRQNLGAAQIRILGGGATQFSIAGGNPEADVNQTDIGFYIQDDWKLRSNFTISPGLRYENQTNINSNSNFAPRIGFAWSPSFGSKKITPPATDSKNPTAAKSATPPKPAAPSQPKTVIRGGIGIFYNRISEGTILQARRFNGVNQKQFVVSDPAVLDLFPTIPAISQLDAFAQPQTRRLLAADLAPTTSLRASVNLEHQLPYNLKLNVGYYHGETRRAMRTVNINAPLAGTYNPAVPSSGVRPLGNAAGNILENRSSGKQVFNSLNVGLNGTIHKVSFWSGYSWNKTNASDSGTSGSSFDPYDFSQEWGRASYDIRHWFNAGANYQTKSGFSVNMFMIANSGPPFNITTGKDTNGDTFFTERPAFATDVNKAGVIVTPLGAFDPNPVAGQRIIPKNFGQGPSFFSVNIGISKTFKFGPAIQAKTPPQAANAAVVTATGSQKPPPKPQIQRPYSLSFSVYASNALNHPSRGILVGNMASPYFLKSNGSSGIFFSGPGGSGGSGGNRQITLRARLSF